jgi:hypothetical protein
MSVLIKTMEMPKNCGECQFCHTENFTQWCFPTGQEDVSYDSIPKWCPLDEQKTGWIPCNERLPSAEDCPMDCMVTRRSKYVGNYTDMAVAEADGTWTHEDWKAIAIKGEATCISTRDADIIAWMPLPEPYEEGNK